MKEWTHPNWKSLFYSLKFQGSVTNQWIWASPFQQTFKSLAILWIWQSVSILQSVRALKLEGYILFNHVSTFNQIGRLHSEITISGSLRILEFGRVYVIQFQFFKSSLNLEDTISFWYKIFAMDFCLCPSRYDGISIPSIWMSPLSQNVTYNFTIWLLLARTLNLYHTIKSWTCLTSKHKQKSY